MPTVKDYASCVISRMRLTHVKSHQDTKINKLPFAAQPNTTLCDRMATRHLGFHRDGKCAAQSDLLATRNIPFTMSVDCVQKLVLTFTMTFSKESITRVTNSGAALPGTPSK